MTATSSTAISAKLPHPPALLGQPRKLFVEITTRCNLGCYMCVKQSCDHAIAEGDMSAATFAALEPTFSHLDALVLNGVGEPLIHSDLEHFIKKAKALMPANGWIGFQSNGLLLTQPRALSLLQAGLDRICISIDSASPDTFRKVREGGELDDIDDAFSALASAMTVTGNRDFKIGVEFVLLKSNLHELPDALTWAARRGASFAVVTHALPYASQHAADSLYADCTDQALSIFEKWKAEAEQEGIDIYRYFDVIMRYAKTGEDKRLIGKVEALKIDAEKRGVLVDVKRLLSLDLKKYQDVAEVFQQAREVADALGLELKLPQLVPAETRRCGFVEEGGAFVSWDGSVSPCYFLWHRYRCFASGWEQQVHPKVFGNVNNRDILEIWNGKDFLSFRQGVLAYDYPQCASCSLAPCDYVQTEEFEQDCHIREVPCGACLWCTGIFQCLS